MAVSGQWVVDVVNTKKPVPCGWDGCGDLIAVNNIRCKWCPFDPAATGSQFHLQCAIQAGASGVCAKFERTNLKKYASLSKQQLAQLNAALRGDLSEEGDTAILSSKTAVSPSMEKTVTPQKGKKKPASDAEGSKPDAKKLKTQTGGLNSAPTALLQTKGTAADVQKLRFTDFASETEMLGPIHGVMKVPRMSLIDAAAATGLADLDACAFLASEHGAQLTKNDAHGLTKDEAAALNLYTMESELYPALNRLLRSKERQQLKAFFPFLQLMLRAKAKMPAFVGTIWRGVKADLRKQYPKGREMYWWAFSSCTKTMSTLTDPKFLGKKGARTIFNVQVQSGIDIAHYSVFEDAEAEVLLFPGMKLKVIDTLEAGSGLHIIHLEEVKVPVKLVK